jgi:hypothetical protein
MLISSELRLREEENFRGVGGRKFSARILSHMYDAIILHIQARYITMFNNNGVFLIFPCKSTGPKKTGNLKLSILGMDYTAITCIVRQIILIDRLTNININVYYWPYWLLWR